MDREAQQRESSDTRPMSGKLKILYIWKQELTQWFQVESFWWRNTRIEEAGRSEEGKGRGRDCEQATVQLITPITTLPIFYGPLQNKRYDETTCTWHCTALR